MVRLKWKYKLPQQDMKIPTIYFPAKKNQGTGGTGKLVTSFLFFFGMWGKKNW